MNPDVVAEATHRVLFWWIVASCWRRSRLLCLAGPVSVRDATARLVARQVRATAETGSVGRCSDKRPDSDVLSSRHTSYVSNAVSAERTCPRCWRDEETPTARQT